MIEARALSRRYGDLTAVEGVTFSVHEGEILGILGPNGAGKTTTLRMITGFLPPTSGSVTLAGEDLFGGPRSAAARRRLGYLPENVALYPEMWVREYLAYRGRLQGLSGAAAADAVQDALTACRLEEVERRLIGTLSKGFRQRVGLAAAILHRPQVLVLDEPTVGLDPQQILAVRRLIRDLGKRCTLLLSTHILPEVELLCDRVLILDRGALVDQGTPGDLRRRWMAGRQVRISFDGPAPNAVVALSALPGVSRVRPADDTGATNASQKPGVADGSSLVVECREGIDPRADIFRLAVANGWVLVELTEQEASLEDLFLRLTTHDTMVVEEA